MDEKKKENYKDPVAQPKKAPVKTKDKPTRLQRGVVHYAGIPCVAGKNVPVVDATYSYNRANVACKRCLEVK